MRILYLNPFSQRVSGPDESLLTLLGAIIPMGVEAHVMLPRPGPQVPRYKELGVKVHFASLSVLRRHWRPRDLLLFGPRLALGIRAVARIARGHQIDLIHTNMEVVLDGAIAARFLGIPHVLHYRGNTLDRPKLAFDFLTRLWTRTAQRVFCISEATAELFRKRGLGANVEVLYNPIDVEAFASAERSEEVRRELGADAHEILIGTVGRIHARKDMATFLRAGSLVIRQFPNVRLTVVGTAESPEELEYHEELKVLALKLGLAARLSWAGVRRDMPRVFKAIDVFVLCSRHEGFGRVVVEAMAAGTPMVVSREGALRELLEEGRYSLFAEPDRPDDFAQKMCSLCADARRPLSEPAGNTRLESCSKAGIAARVTQAYRSLAPLARCQ
jgi:glycosyltransferase involved in cell wall biosynthesis